MIPFFSRSEVLLTREEQVYMDACDKLKGAGIDYQTKCRDMLRNRSIRARRSVIGLRQDYLYEYVIYVHRVDAERAKHILQQ